MEDEYFTVEELAKLVKMNEQTIRRAIIKGHIHAFRVGYGKKSPYRIPKEELGRIRVMGFVETVNNILSLPDILKNNK